MSDKSVCRTALAKLGLLNDQNNASKIPLSFKILSFCNFSGVSY